MVVLKGSGSDPAKHLNTGWRSTEPVTCLHLRTPHNTNVQPHRNCCWENVRSDFHWKNPMLFSDPFWTCDQIQKLDIFLWGKIPRTLSRRSKVLLLLLLLTGLADNFLSCLFFSRRFEFWLNEKFHGCFLPFGRCPCLCLRPLLPTLVSIWKPAVVPSGEQWLNCYSYSSSPSQDWITGCIKCSLSWVSDKPLMLNTAPKQLYLWSIALLQCTLCWKKITSGIRTILYKWSSNIFFYYGIKHCIKFQQGF